MFDFMHPLATEKYTKRLADCQCYRKSVILLLLYSKNSLEASQRMQMWTETAVVWFP